MNLPLKYFLFVMLTLAAYNASAQQLYMEVFTARHRTNFNKAPYQKNKLWYSPVGLRLAAGADNFQVGGEYRLNLTNPKWQYIDSISGDTSTHKFVSSYYGALFRAKISRYPARRFGLTIIAGAGYVSTERQETLDGETVMFSYDNTLAYNGSVGVSFPTGKQIMVEFAYSYFHIDYAEKENLPQMIGSYHSFHLGMSFNFVFGKRAKKYDKISKG